MEYAWSERIVSSWIERIVSFMKKLMQLIKIYYGIEKAET